MTNDNSPTGTLLTGASNAGAKIAILDQMASMTGGVSSTIIDDGVIYIALGVDVRLSHSPPRISESCL